MTWPGQRLWRPHVGLIAVLPREYYNEFDNHERRPTVVVRVLPVERVCIVVTRTSQLDVPHHRDIWTDKDLDLLCDKQGWWQPWRSHRVNFTAYDDPEVGGRATMPGELLARIIDAYERCL